MAWDRNQMAARAAKELQDRHSIAATALPRLPDDAELFVEPGLALAVGHAEHVVGPR